MSIKEMWKKVVGFDAYAVSNMGAVRRVKQAQGTKCRLLNPSVNKAGYVHVSLTDGLKKRRVFVHILVLEAFIGPKPTPKHQCNHANGRKNDNRHVNLEWSTSKENNIHKCRVLGKAAGRNHVLFGKVGKDHNRSRDFQITSPDGDVFKITGLCNFCKNNGLTLSAMYDLCVSARRQKHKGWKCKFWSQKDL